ncbi:MAG: ATP synthase subunit I [Candidatus Protistobacter heckmanni]|nr:ATP synthase subunit I [Candidatus Protistobacter heckmanni]
MYKSDQHQEEEEEEIVPLTHAQALNMFGERAMRPSCMTPCGVLSAQVGVSILSALGWTVWAWIAGGDREGAVDLVPGLSALMGGAICFVPAALFALELSRVERNRSVTVMVIGEVVKVLFTLALFTLVAAKLADVRWLPLGLTYLLALKTYWVALVLR